MSCENCGSAQLPGALYCIHCGHPFPGECPECGFANPPDARFCGGCRRVVVRRRRRHRGRTQAADVPLLRPRRLHGALRTAGSRRRAPGAERGSTLVQQACRYARRLRRGVRRRRGRAVLRLPAGPGERSRARGPVRARDGPPGRVGAAHDAAVRAARGTSCHPHGPGHARPGQPRRRPPLGGVRRRDQHHRQAAEERPAGRGRRNGRDLGVDARVLHRALTRAGRAGRGVPADHRMAGGDRGPGARLGRRAAHRRSVRGPRTRTTPRRRALASGHRGRDAFRPPSR